MFIDRRPKLLQNSWLAGQCQKAMKLTIVGSIKFFCQKCSLRRRSKDGHNQGAETN
jgi:hypothetical protein